MQDIVTPKASTSTRKILVYALIGVVIISIAYILLLRNPVVTNTNFPKSGTGALVANSKMEAIATYQKQFCGLDSKPNANDYIFEYKLPQKCEMPLAIAVDETASKVWYISTKNGTLGSFDTKQNRFDREQTIPIWSARQAPTDSSQVWDMKLGPTGDIWFTDEKQNSIWKYLKSSQRFEMYKVPDKSRSLGTAYPVSLDFDKQGNIYFVGIRSPALWYADTSKLKNGTSEGITKIPIPIGGFKGIDPDLISTGSVVVDRRTNIVWISMLVFNTKGQILRYEISNKTFKIFDMPEAISSPVGMVVDNNGGLWVTDHGTSLFYKLDPITGKITQFSTSKISPRIFGVMSNLMPEGAYTLPYWIKKGSDDSLWFNEHTGNKIARFDVSNLTLTEYWIPSQNKLWGQCPVVDKECGIANALQFSLGEHGSQLWFTEWSENKIAKLSSVKPLPITVSASPSEITVRKGESSEIKVNVKAVSGVTVDMSAAGPFTRNGDLGNSSGTFSEQTYLLRAGNSKEVSYIFTPSSDLVSGQYMLMLGADVNPVTLLKAVKINIV